MVVITILASISTNHVAIIIIPSRTSSEQKSIQFKSFVQIWSPLGLEPVVPITLVLEFGDTILLLEETQRRRLGHLPLFVIVECRNPYCRWGHMLMVVLTLMLKLMLMLLYMLAYEFKMPIHKMLIERKHHCVQRFPFKTQFGNKESKLFLRSST